MSRSSIGRVLLTAMALAAVATGIGLGRAASSALGRVVGDVSRTVSDFHPEESGFRFTPIVLLDEPLE